MVYIGGSGGALLIKHHWFLNPFSEVVIFITFMKNIQHLLFLLEVSSFMKHHLQSALFSQF